MNLALFRGGYRRGATSQSPTQNEQLSLIRLIALNYHPHIHTYITNNPKRG